MSARLRISWIVASGIRLKSSSRVEEGRQFIDRRIFLSARLRAAASFFFFRMLGLS